MPSWTKEQQEAIYKEGTNIIVSAGAGSGKTAVLSERVIRKLHDGVNINEMLILTFTEAAAFEMKERIRKKIKKDEELKTQLDLIDSSYITTFDSFSLSIVKRYHYLLNIEKNVSIMDSSMIQSKKIEILEEIMNEYYEKQDENFVKIINDFCLKDDNEIKNTILSISNKMDLIIDKDEYLDKYFDTYFSEEFIDSKIDEYESFIKGKFNKIIDLGKEFLSFSENKVYDDTLNIINKYECCNNITDIKEALSLSLPRLSNGSSEEFKNIKEKWKEKIEELNNYLPVEDNIKEQILSTKRYQEILIEIVKKLDNRFNEFKLYNCAFEFIDIAKLAIKVVKENDEVRDELKYFFKEIMIDEYQDTSDLQETFINLIANNNVYMVGDIKQAIYRFRNANPNIFKDKYNNYKNNNGGYKIDLLKNFRSREEVLNNINILFDPVMDLEIGGAEYQESHRMIFGNTSYNEKGKTEENYNFEILTYDLEKGFDYSKNEVEIFTIAKDIKDKVDNKYQIFDKDTGLLHDAKYSDFAILIDRSTSFDLYKKIFEYLSIPLNKYTSTNITKDDEIHLIKNILTLIINIYKKDREFKYSFISVARSYLYGLSDQEIFDYVTNSNYEDSDIYQKILNIRDNINIYPLKKIIENIIKDFNFHLNSIKVGNALKVDIKLDYILNLAEACSEMGYGIIEFRDYLNTIIEKDMKIECNFSDNSDDSVKIMTIHKSKGLEFSICYFPGNYSKFNIRDLNERFIFDPKYGIICPYYNKGIGTTIYKYLYKNDYIKDEISEKIRLFYVSLTRCKEKMIIVSPLKDLDIDSSNVIDNDIRLNYRSFTDILNSVYYNITPYIKEIDLNSIGLTKKYNTIKEFNYKDKILPCKDTFNKIVLSIPNEIEEKEHFSKVKLDLLDKETKNKMELGTYVHYLFELLDFNNLDYSYIDSKYLDYVKSFVDQLDMNNAKIYKEYEFIYEDKNIVKHGIIDLMLEYDDKIKIIDYKLKDINDSKYLDQLNGYKKYIEMKTSKNVSIYLYSIFDKKIVELP